MRLGLHGIVAIHSASAALSLIWLGFDGPTIYVVAFLAIPLFLDIVYFLKWQQPKLRALPWAEEHFDQILNSMDHLILVKGPKSRILWANKAFLDYYGMTNEELRGIIDAPFSELDNTLQYVKDDANVFTSGKSLEIPQEPVTRHDGVVRYFHTVKSPIFDKNGNVIMTVGVSRDITDKLETEKQIENERARALYSSKMATLGEMAGSVAHEINTPLTTAVLLAEQIQRLVAEDHIQREQIHRHAERMIEIARRIASIINGLRRFSREGSRDEKAPHDLRHIIEDTLSFCRERFSLNSINLQIDIPEDLVVQCNPTQISQVLLNLLSNAMDVVQNIPERWIRISAVKTDNIAEIRIFDSGPGVPEPLQAKIFMPFFTTKDIGKGTGLGLSISKNIIESHGGELSLEQSSSPTCFKLTLPIPPL